jgi:hypothetical protein
MTGRAIKHHGLGLSTELTSEMLPHLRQLSPLLGCAAGVGSEPLAGGPA